MTQKDIVDYLKLNPYNTNVNVGSLEDMNGKDYIFVDYLTENLIGSDDKGVYKTSIQLTVATKDFDKRKQLVNYIQNKFNVDVVYEMHDEYEYYLARCTFEGILNG